jgi:RNA polymerase sigma-70 factor (ECF subfamily)
VRERTRIASDIPSLTARMAAGDEAAYRQFHALYFDRLLRYLLVLTANEETARETLQMTFLRVARHVRKFESEEALWSWLTVLARSAVVDENRKSRRYLDFLGRFFAHKQVESDMLENRTEARLFELLEAGLATLPEAHRDLLERKYLQGQPVSRMAQDLVLSEKAVEARLVRARQTLRELLLAQLKHEK